MVARAAGFVTLLLVSGSVLARSERRGGDVFAALWWGLAAMSIVGMLLARVGWFSLATLSLGIAGMTVLAAPLAWWRARHDPEPVVQPLAARRARRLAGIAALMALAWVWPPFETFMAAADSTMYVDAGVHLAQTGTYDVPTTVAPMLPDDLAEALFASVGVLGQGPYVRLPGGLLMRTRDADHATPAFFPLLPVWAGTLTAVGGAALAPAVAPIGTALAVWALALFAAECLGIAEAAVTALVFLGNFAVWWFGRFSMSEPLTVAFVWGGLVFLRRGSPFAAGLMLGIGGVARAETLIFVVAALAWWSTWRAVHRRDVVAVTAGVALAGSLAAVGLFRSPNHQVAYLLNDFAFASYQVASRIPFRAFPALWDGRVFCALALLPMLPLSVAIGAAGCGAPVLRTTARTLLALGTVLATMLYLRLGGRPEPLRHLGWIAGSLSYPGLVLAVAGGVRVWRHGGTAARLGVVLVVLVAALFVPSPRVSTYQPWAMRRFLPVVLPGLALGVGACAGLALKSGRRSVQAAGVALVVVVVGLQVRPILAARHAGYFAGSLTNVRKIADAVPDDAVIVIDGQLADLQMQVPLWLVFGRETAMASGGGPAWRALLGAVAARHRPIVWIQNRYAPSPTASGFEFTPILAEADFSIDLPDSPADTPPTFVMRKVVPLAVYGVAVGSGPMSGNLAR